MVKLTDVAALAGVSSAAASRVLSGDTTIRVSDATRERVLDAARQLEYVPNHAGRSLRTSRSSTIALVIPDVTSAVFAELANGAEQAAAARGLAIVLGRAERVQEDGDWLRRMLGESRIDGVILQLSDGTELGQLDAMAARGTPIVVINSIDEGPLSTIVLDDAAGIRIAVEHLHSVGHQQIGLVGGMPGNATAQRREAGFRAGMADAALTVREEWITRLGYTGSDGRAAVDVLEARGPLPTGLVVANLNAALGVLAAIHARELRVPSDVSIVAMHDVWYADATWPPITTVRMPMRELGAAAVARVVNGGQTPTHAVIDAPSPELILRQSTAAPR
ncbi:MAG: LacI family DNA-binding transcriptional regulator [Pseudolysinimonas sp.]